jgi:hypothetical protein
MIRRHRLGKLLLFSVAALLLLFVVARWYLSSAAVARRVEQQLEALVGGTVKVGAANLGIFGGSSLTGVQLYEPGAATSDRPWLEVDSVSMDRAALGLARGELPNHIHLEHPQVLLRFDKDDRLITQLPELTSRPGAPTPDLHIDNGELTLDCEDRPPMLLHGIQATISGDAGGVRIEGSVHDPEWGEWTVQGRYDMASHELALDLQTSSTEVTTEKIQAVPFLAGISWEGVYFDGRAPVRLSLRFPPAGTKDGSSRVRYHVEVEPTDTNVLLAMDGRVPMRIRGLQGKLSGDEMGLLLDGIIHDPNWGTWTVQGRYDAPARQLSLDLQAPPMQITMEKLKAVPYIPLSVWDEVQVEGMSPVEVALKFPPRGAGGGDSTVHYRVDLDPMDTHVSVASIDLTADHASGKVTVEDKLVTLSKVVGHTADGEIKVEGTLDFRGLISDMKYKIDVAGLSLRGLPRKWGVPQDFDGKLTGHADLGVQVVQEKVRPSGKGKGHIDQLRLGKRPLPGKMELLLDADEKGFRFTSPSGPMGTIGSLLGLGLVAPSPHPQPLSPKGRGEKERPPLAAKGRGEKEVPLTEQALQALLAVPQGVIQGVTRATQQGIDIVASGLKRAQQLMQPPPPGQPHNYLEADFSVEDVDLAELISGLNIKLPFPVGGRASVKVRLGIPTDATTDARAYRAEGTADLPRLDVAGVELAGIHAQVRYAEGVLRLTELRGTVPPPPVGAGVAVRAAGTFTGTARVMVSPLEDLTADLHIDRVPVDRFLVLLPGIIGDTTGEVSGKVHGKVPVKRLTDAAAWEATAEWTSPSLRVVGITIQSATVDAELARGVVNLSNFKGDLEGGTATGSGDMRLASPYAYKARLDLQKVDIAALNRLVPEYRPPVTAAGSLRLDANLRGSFEPLVTGASGKAEARRLRVEGMSLESLSFEWEVKGRAVLLRGIEGRFDGGDIRGTATVPLADTEQGEADLRLQSVPIENLLRSIPAMPLRIEGHVDGTVRGGVTAARPDQPRRLTTQIDLSASQLRIQGVPAQRIKGNIDYRGGAGEYDLRGETLGGRFRLQGKLPPLRPAAPPPAKARPARQPDEPPPDGRLTIEGARLNRLWGAFGMEQLKPLHGVLSVDLPFRHEGPERRPVGAGSFRIIDIRWDNEDRADTLQGDLRIDGDRLEVCNASGTLGEGLVRAHLLFPFGRGRGSFNLTLTQVDAARLVPPWSDLLQGPMDLSLRGSIDGGLNGGGAIVLTRGKVLGVEVSEWRLPVQFSVALRRGDLELTVNDMHAVVAHGRAMGRGAFTQAAGSGRLEGNIRFHDLDMRALVAASGEGNAFGGGRVAGRIDLGGSDIRSADDVTATISATLSQTQALQLPVLKQLTPYLRPGMSASSFQSGQLEARLSRGSVRIQKLTLEGRLLQMIVEGTISLQGRIDLEVTARTDNIAFLPPGLRLLGLRLPAAGVLPVGLITEASLLLANRTVHLRVTGTLRSPVIQVEPIRLLTQEAVRYFLTRALFPTP